MILNGIGSSNRLLLTHMFFFFLMARNIRQNLKMFYPISYNYYILSMCNNFGTILLHIMCAFKSYVECLYRQIFLEDTFTNIKVLKYMHPQIGKSNIPPMRSEHNTKFNIWVPKVLNCDTKNQIHECGVKCYGQHFDTPQNNTLWEWVKSGAYQYYNTSTLQNHEFDLQS